MKPEKRDKLKILLKEKVDAFQGTRGAWKGKPIEQEIVEGSKPLYARAYTVLKASEVTAKKEVNMLEIIGLLKKVKTS